MAASAERRRGYAPTVDGRAERLDVRRAVGAVTGGAIVAAVAVACPPRDFEYRQGQSRVYGTETWWVLALLAVGAALIVVRPALRGVGAAIAAVAAVQLVGTGLVAHRRWMTSGGLLQPAANLGTLRLLASVLSAVASLVVAAAVYVLRAERALAPPGRRRFVAPAVIGGIAVAALVPLGMGWEPGNGTTQVGAHALMYGIPWGLAIAGSAALRPRPRIAAIAAVLVSALTLLWWKPMIWAEREALGFVVVFVAVVLTTPIGRQQMAVARSSSSGRSDVGGDEP